VRFLMWIVVHAIIVVSPLDAKAEQALSWQAEAQRYVELTQQMYEGKASDRGVAIEQHRLHQELEQKLAQATGPSKRNWQKMVQSSDPLQRKMALVLAIAKQSRDPDYIRVVIDGYASETDKMTKFYTHRLLGYQTDKDLKQFQHAIIKMMHTDTSDELRMAGLSTLLKLDSAVSYPMLLRYVETGSKGLVRYTYYTLRSSGDRPLDQLIQELFKKDNRKVLAMFDSFEKDLQE